MQSKLHSGYEVVANVVAGYFLAILVQVAVYPLFGIETGMGENALISAFFTVASLVRSYVLRRVFNWLQ